MRSQHAGSHGALRHLVKTFVICLSFANLFFVHAWAELLSREVDFFRKYSVNLQKVAAVFLDVLLLAVVLWIFTCLMARAGKPWCIRILKWCAFAGVALLLNFLWVAFQASSFEALPIVHVTAVRMLLSLFGIVAGAMLVRNWEKIGIPLTSTILKILSPALPLILASLAWDIHKGPPAGRFADRPPVAALPRTTGAPHVLWFIFDEWDQALTFGRRPATMALPELDRFRSQAFHTDRAYPPAPFTSLSVPSLLAERTFIQSDTGDPSEVMLTFEKGQPRLPLSSQPTIFSEARGAGFNAGIVGFYLPYCRLFDAVSCEWHSYIGFTSVEGEYSLSLGQLMLLAAKRQAARLPGARPLGLRRALGEDPLKPARHAVTYREIRQQALAAIVDPRLSLVYIHASIPHPPAAFEDDLPNGKPATYLDNLTLLDRTVGEVRRQLENAGMWESSTILLTSDHPLRLGHWRPELLFPSSGSDFRQASQVPFLLKLAGEQQGFAYDGAMQTVVTKDLLLAIMKGEITQPEQVAAWLEHNPPRNFQ